MIKRKIFLKTGLGLGAALLVILAWSLPGAVAAQSPQVPIAGSAIPQFAQALPLLSVQTGGTITTAVGNTDLTLRMCEFKAKILPPTFVPPAGSTYPGYTWVWGYLVDPNPAVNTCANLIAHYGDANGILNTYTGPVTVSQRNGGSTNVTYVNDLPIDSSTTNVTFWKYSVDQTLMWADPLGNEANNCDKLVNTFGFPGGTDYPPFGDACAQNYTGPVPAVPHLHGGEVPPELDGGPDAWFTSNLTGTIQGHGYYSFAGAPTNGALYKYPNTQEAAPIWFHDHLLGGTRLNVYAGLAGAYYIYDPSLNLPANLQPVASVIPLVLQDRMFDTNGQLFFPGDTAGGVLWSINPEHPYWVPEFIGDTIVVNGKAWPFLNVEAKRYRFLLLNGSNARTYELFLPNPLIAGTQVPMYVISTDGGYLDAPAAVNKLLIMPGERYEVIIDFATLAGRNVILKNTGRSPYPKGAPPTGTTLGQIIQFRVGAVPAGGDTSYNPASGTPLRSDTQKIVRLANPATGALAPGVTAQVTRQLTLNEVALPPKTVTDPVTNVTTAYPGGPVEILVNNTKLSGFLPNGGTRNDFKKVTTGTGTTGLKDTYYSEVPQEGNTEVWEIVNTTADAHPIHLHLVQFQIINRQNFNVGNYFKAYSLAFSPSTWASNASGCTAGTYCPGFGPPLSYNDLSAATGGKYGGNPDVTKYLQDGINLPLPQEQGWKDTVVALPGVVTRLAVRWAPTSLPTNTPAAQLYFPFNPDGIDSNQPGHGYVWHCHIIDHEDNEMMRPDVVILNPAAPLPGTRPLVKGTAY